MTRKLFYDDPYIREADCTVLSVTEENGKAVFTLNASPFFPEGGGQSCDTGTVNGIKLINVTEKDGVIRHEIPSPAGFSAGDTVHCEADGLTRFYRMQAHTGEHIFSGICHRLYGAENVGFHMDGTVMTVDFDLPLTEEQLKTAEKKANEAVWADIPVRAEIYTPEKAKDISFRSKKEFAADVRIVTIDGIDCCACCAPHVKRTGEIGLIMMLSHVSHRGGVRLTLVCGKTALDIALDRFSQTKEAAQTLTVPQEQAYEGLRAFITKTEELRQEKKLLTQRLCRAAVKKVRENGPGSVTVLEDFSPDELTETAAMLYASGFPSAVLLSGGGEKGYAFVITSQKADIAAKAKEMTAALRGRGGGKNGMLRGRFSATEEEIKKYFEDNPL